MLGSLTEADDAVQDAWLRLSRSEASEIENLGGWLTTVVARVCLNMPRAGNIRPEDFLDAHMPDPSSARTASSNQRTRRYWPTRSALLSWSCSTP